MKLKIKFSLILIIFIMVHKAFSISGNDWKFEIKKGYWIYFKSQDTINLNEYEHLIQNGIEQAVSFFDNNFPQNFNVYIHPNRQTLDSTWRKDWNMPDFKSECWMVASGIATKLDIISPKIWNTESCEHDYSETIKTQQLITHELVHVFHGQMNPSPDFATTTGIDWFIEGLATYASGQCDSIRINAMMIEIKNNTAPVSLDNFWKGKNKYGLSGSIVMYIDKNYGRKKLYTLLHLTNKAEILNALDLTEPKLIHDWKNYLQLHYGNK